jgi:hypothetical protein
MRSYVMRGIALALLACALLAVALTRPPAATANDTSLGATGGTVYPVRSTDIRLAAETVQVTCFGRFAEFRIDFRFVNEGERQKVKLGFPFTDVVDSLEQDGTPRPVGFQAWRDGRPLAVTAIPARMKGGRMTAG